jgi:hypothetical protein
MRIDAAMAAALAALTEALDQHGTDIAHSLHQLTHDAAAAISSYLGLSVVVSQSDPPLTITTLADGAAVADICTSLHMLLRGMKPGQAPVALILYAATPGAFVDLAADVTWLKASPMIEVTLDEHLLSATGRETATQLHAASDINQAIGVLIGRGYTPHEAHREIDTHAATNHTDRHSAARLILDAITD